MFPLMAAPGNWSQRVLVFVCLFSLLRTEYLESKNPLLSPSTHTGIECSRSVQISLAARKGITSEEHHLL